MEPQEALHVHGQGRSISQYEGEADDAPVTRASKRAPLTTKQIDLSGKSAKERLETLLDLTVGLVNTGPEFSRLEALKQAKALILDMDSIEKVEQPATQKGPDISALTASILDNLDNLQGSASQTDAEPTPLPSENAAPRFIEVLARTAARRTPADRMVPLSYLTGSRASAASIARCS